MDRSIRPSSVDCVHGTAAISQNCSVKRRQSKWEWIQGLKRNTLTSRCSTISFLVVRSVIAIRVLLDEHKGGVLAPTDLIDGRPVLEILRDKHPEGQPLEPNSIQRQHPRTLPYHPAVFDNISARLVRKHAMKTHGSAGPSGLDADDWRTLLLCRPPRTCASLLPILLRGWPRPYYHQMIWLHTMVVN